MKRLNKIKREEYYKFLLILSPLKTISLSGSGLVILKVVLKPNIFLLSF
ncbi:hypothetical protein QIA36_04855 (plasmid) [Borreliella yangtzensis]